MLQEGTRSSAGDIVLNVRTLPHWLCPLNPRDPTLSHTRRVESFPSSTSATLGTLGTPASCGIWESPRYSMWPSRRPDRERHRVSSTVNSLPQIVASKTLNSTSKKPFPLLVSSSVDISVVSFISGSMDQCLTMRIHETSGTSQHD